MENFDGIDMDTASGELLDKFLLFTMGDDIMSFTFCNFILCS